MSLSSRAAPDAGGKRREIVSRIQKERKMMAACQAMKQATPNVEVQSDCDRKIRESQRMISYFEERLAELEERSASPMPDDQARSKRLPPVPLLNASSNARYDQPMPSSNSTTFSTRSHQAAPKIHYSNLGGLPVAVSFVLLIHTQWQTSSRPTHL
jgi:hypothetical protein